MANSDDEAAINPSSNENVEEISQKKKSNIKIFVTELTSRYAILKIDSY